MSTTALLSSSSSTHRAVLGQQVADQPVDRRSEAGTCSRRFSFSSSVGDLLLVRFFGLEELGRRRLLLLHRLGDALLRDPRSPGVSRSRASGREDGRRRSPCRRGRRRIWSFCDLRMRSGSPPWSVRKRTMSSGAAPRFARGGVRPRRRRVRRRAARRRNRTTWIACRGLRDRARARARRYRRSHASTSTMTTVTYVLRPANNDEPMQEMRFRCPSSSRRTSRARDRAQQLLPLPGGGRRAARASRS